MHKKILIRGNCGKKRTGKFICKKYKVTPEQSGEIVDNVLELLKDVFAKEEVLRIINFGVFEIRETKERKIVDPRDGTKINHARPRKYIKFKGSRNLEKELFK